MATEGMFHTPSDAILWAIFTDLHGFATSGICVRIYDIGIKQLVYFMMMMLCKISSVVWIRAISERINFLQRKAQILESYRPPFFCLLHPLSLVTSLGGDNWAIMGVFCYVLFYSKIWNNSILAVILWNNNNRFERSKYKPRHIVWKRLCVPTFSRNWPVLLLI